MFYMLLLQRPCRFHCRLKDIEMEICTTSPDRETYGHWYAAVIRNNSSTCGFRRTFPYLSTSSCLLPHITATFRTHIAPRIPCATILGTEQHVYESHAEEAILRYAPRHYVTGPRESSVKGQSSQDDFRGHRLPIDRRCVRIACKSSPIVCKAPSFHWRDRFRRDVIRVFIPDTQHSMYTPSSIQLLLPRQLDRLILATYTFQEPEPRLFFSFLEHGLMSLGLWDRVPLRLCQFGKRSRSRRNNLVLCQRLAPRGGVTAV
jgi:hypothetical protein